MWVLLKGPINLLLIGPNGHWVTPGQTWNKVAANYGGGATLPLMTPPSHSLLSPSPKVPPTPKKQAVAELFCNLTCHYRWLQICLQTRLQTYQPELSYINSAYFICRRVCRRVCSQFSKNLVFFTLFSHFFELFRKFWVQLSPSLFFNTGQFSDLLQVHS